MKYFNSLVLIVALANIAACSDESKTEKKEATGDHVWKHQTDTLKDAKDSAKKLEESLKQQKKKMDESN